MSKSRIARARPSDKFMCSPRRGKAESQKRKKNLADVLLQREVVKTGTEVGERKLSNSTAQGRRAREVLWRRCMRARLADF
eukprot:3139641-Pleurochrysis_carterae.AAC.1